MPVSAHALPRTARPPLMLIALACAASLVAGSAGALVVAGEPAEGQTGARDTAHVETIRRFYAGVNELLRTGDPDALTGLLAPDFVERPARLGVPAGRDGLAVFLLALRASVPGSTVTVESIHTAGDHIAARASLAGGQSEATLGLPLGERAGWPALELFRVAGGVIVERWSDAADQALVEPMAEFPVTVAGETDHEVRLSRRWYEPNARHERETAAGQIALVGERGELTVAIETAGNGADEPVRRLAPGDVLLLPEGTRFTTNNGDRAMAQVLVLALAANRVDMSWTPEPGAPPGVSIEPLAWGSAGVLPAAAVVRIGYLTLAPGVHVPIHAVAGLDVLRVETGAVGLISDEPMWLNRGLADGAFASRSGTLDSGHSAIVTATAHASYQNASAAPVRLLVVTIQPAEPVDSPL